MKAQHARALALMIGGTAVAIASRRESRRRQSLFSYRSPWSILSASSVLSIASAASVMSIGSFASVLSIGSSHSFLSIGSDGGFLSVGSRPRPRIHPATSSASSSRAAH